MRRSLKGNQSAFTLVEMTVVLIVLAIMGALAVPAFRRWVQEDDLTVATRRLEALFKLARDSAVYSGVPVTVWMDSASGGVWLVAAPRDSTARTDSARAPRAGSQPARAQGEAIELPAAVQIELSKARVRFRFATSGAVFADSLVLRTSTAARLITLHPWTGDVLY